MPELIPTFEVGQRVRVYNRPIEWSCPSCGGSLFEEWADDSYLATVLYDDKLQQPQCRSCGEPQKFEGWIKIQLDGFVEMNFAPYTLIEPWEE